MSDEPEHPTPTARSGYRYVFTSKHHGGGASGDSRWAITQDEEFSVFDTADQHAIADSDGRLYGVLRQGGGLADLGTWFQQVAEFPWRRKAPRGMATRSGR